MYNSIQYFIENITKEIEKDVELMVKDEMSFETLLENIQNHLLKLGTEMVAEILESLDDTIRESETRKKHWNIEQRNQTKTLLDVMGNITYSRTYYYNKKTKENVYLLDQLIGYEPKERMTLRAKSSVIEEAIESSYSKGGKRASLTDNVSKQTTKNLIHDTVVEMPIKEAKEKKKIKHLHIVADEDHVSKQFNKEKGDLPRDVRGNTINTMIPKLICLYEDVINESGNKSKNPRYKLIGKRYFGGIYSGNGANEELWLQVAEYIDTVYDTEYLERVYIAGDGASWIKTGCEYIPKSKFVLDKYHMMKYVNASVSPLLDSAEEGKAEIWDALNRADKETLKDVYKRILDVTEDENKREVVKKALRYFLNSWEGIQIKVDDHSGCRGCCAEGQISHVLSSRMSSRPMGWSVHGCGQMTKFRIFKYNGGKVIDLLEYQKKEQKKQEHRKEQEDLIKELKTRRSGWNSEETIQAYIPGIEKSQMKWIRRLRNHAV